jgi:hypothetical protein
MGDFATKHSGVRDTDSKFLFPEDTLLLRRDVIDRTIEYLKSRPLMRL